MRYYAAKCGPTFACGANGGLPCGWGAAKVMLAFGALPPERRSPRIARAIDAGVEFLLGIDPATAAYPTPTGARPNGAWWKLGFPVFYVTDVLQVVEALVSLGHGDDPRLAAAMELVRSKRDGAGRWCLEYGYGGKTWVDVGPKGRPNRWVTIRALRALGAPGTTVTG